MTDAEKLRSIGRNYVGYDFAKVLFRIADLLDAVPPETLEAIKAVPVALLRQIAGQKLSEELSEEELSDADFMGGYDTVVRVARAMLASAPAKPEDER